MDNFRPKGYSRLDFGGPRPHDAITEIELQHPRNAPELTTAEPSQSSALLISPNISGPRELGRRTNTRWDPLFLRRWILIAFALFSAAVIAALQVVYTVSQNNHGIATSSDSDHYLWTYGPTAVFVVVTVLWRQVDYAAKSIQPWAEMAKGPQRAEHSLLLDYVTPLQVSSFWKSVRRGHFAVSSSIVVFLLIKVITVLSTGMFSLQSVRKNGVPTSMAINNTFDGTRFHDAESVDSRAAYVAYGHKAYNISLPVGTTDQYAVQSFYPGDGFVNGSLTYSAAVDVFNANLSCESGVLKHTTAFDELSTAPIAAYYNTSVTLPGCQIFNAYLDAPNWFYMQNDTTHQFGYRASFQNVTCSNLAIDDPTRYRYMIAATYSEGFSQDNNTMLNSSNIVCVPSYSVQSAMVTLDTQGNVKSVNLTGKPRRLNNLSAVDIADGVLATTQQASAISTSTSYDVALDVFTTMMQQDTVNFKAEDLLDTTYLNSTANRIYGQIAAQLANLYLLSDSSKNAAPVIDGTISKDENRLIARQIPIRIMQAVAAVMILLIVVILFVRPRGVVPRSVDSIAAVAAILARSPALEARLRGTGHQSLSELRETLAPHRFMTATGYEDGARTFSIRMFTQVQSGLHGSPDRGILVPQNIKWTRPFILRRIGMSLTILASIAAIIALETLLSQSRAHDGLGTVNDDSATRYSWLYVPVLIFLLLATLFNIMDFEIEFTESFHALAKADCEAKSSMLWYPLRHISLHATYNGLRHSRFALTAASVSAVLAPLLTIIVSGLFTTQATTQGIAVQANALDWFNTTTLADTSTNVPLLVIEGNMSYPQWTYSELAVPQLSLVGDDADQLLRQGGALSVDTPAVRGAVACNVVPEDRIMNTAISNGQLSSNISTPDLCGNTGSISEGNTWLFSSMEVPVNAPGYFSSNLVLGFLDTCPTLALYYGHVTDNKIDHFIPVLCTQYLERVQANVTFNLPDFSISTDPVVHPNSAVNFSRFYTGFPALQVLNISSTADKLDDTFNAMVYGKDGTPTNELLDESTLIASYTHLYRQYMAQVVNSFLRADFSTLSTNATETVVNPLQASYINPRHFRLVQSPLSTHLLVGVVGALLICALVVFITIDMRNVLPKPVGSIAAVASLLAGSRIVDPKSGMVPPGSEYWSDDEWEKSGVWQSEMFRMGWWNKFQEPGDSWRGRQNGITMGPGEGQIHDFSHGDSLELPASFRIDARPKVG
ncbi:uncharacterized protein Z519_09555 [Cladophialophora bantiana CBS 173.52]|uniref:Uncharacterized protein n=1 Tax=Cladophialophora bantiana (strain ATCC 10958 / CBS 173.52 / CDC B-1940 / NIH 8579) TaxID=1442370 RepID=A0A0D2HZV6_CLAB1|nr:uncharacterized protein Z519_09555 [Cladophialophora bantiana CBS 173.52]KIW90124.1 hypothetical protein Z519_09555 [Cladophialophora bantiana CBS 173.52]